MRGKGVVQVLRVPRELGEMSLVMASTGWVGMICSNKGDRDVIQVFSLLDALDGGNLSNPVTFAFRAHHGPVYAVDISPFQRNVFLTCSTDSTARIYSLLEVCWVGVLLLL